MFAVGCALLYLVVCQVGADTYIETLKSVNFVFLVPSLFVTLSIRMVAAFRLSMVYNKSGIKLKFKDSFWMVMLSSLIGFVLKGVGFVSLVEMIHKKTGVKRTLVTNRFFLIYAINILVCVVGSALGLWLLRGCISKEYVFYFNVVIFGLLSGSVGFLLAIWGPKQIKQIKYYLFEKVPLTERLFGNLLSEQIYSLKGDVSKILLLSVGIWVLASLEWFMVSYAIGTPVPFFTIFCVYSLLSLSRAVPFLPSSLGIYDAVVAFGLYHVGMAPGVGLAFAMLTRVDNIILDAVSIPKIKYLLGEREGRIL